MVKVTKSYRFNQSPFAAAITTIIDDLQKRFVSLPLGFHLLAPRSMGRRRNFHYAIFASPSSRQPVHKNWNLACLDNCEKRTFNYKISATFSSPHRPFHWLLRWLAGWLAVDGGGLEELGQKKFTVMIVVVSLSLKTVFIAL